MYDVKAHTARHHPPPCRAFPWALPSSQRYPSVYGALGVLLTSGGMLFSDTPQKSPLFAAVYEPWRTSTSLKNAESPRSSRLCGLLRTLVNSRLAEGEGFEPPEGVNLQRFSRPPQSTALPPLRAEQTAPSPAAILRAGPVALGGASSAGCRATAQGLPVRTARSI